MRNSSSGMQQEKLKSNYLSAKQAKKKSKATYKAKQKEFKSKMKPYKQALRDAEKAEKQAKSAYKALENKVPNAIGHALKAPAAKPISVEPTALKKRGRQPGISPKMPTAVAPPTAPAAKPLKKTAAATAKATASTGGGDDLTLVKGVGGNIGEMLKANGVKTFASMAATSFDRYKELLKANGMSKFRDPSQWAARAAALANLPAPTKSEAKPVATESATVLRKRGRQPGFSPKVGKAAAAPAAPAVKKGGVINHEEQYKAPKGGRPAKSAPVASSGGDDLTLVKGVGGNIGEMLKANGVRTFADMAATSFDRYKELLKANGMSKFRDPSQWAARAAVLAKLPAPAKTAAKATATEPAAAPKKRGRQPGFSPKAAKSAVATATEAPAKVKGKPGRKAAAKPAATAKTTASTGGDDLTLVKGVGGNIGEMLKANGVRTFADMAATSFDRYKELLKANGMSKFRDPSQWAARAAVLAKLPTPAKTTAKATATAPAAAAPKKRGRQPGFSPKAAKSAVATATEAPAKVKGKPGRKAAEKPAATEPAAAPKKRGRQPGFSPKAASAPAAKPAPAKVEAAPKAPAKPKGPPAKPDDLTQVKGVGGRVAEALNAQGIYTYKDMAAVSLDRYKEILKDNNMSKFRDPSDWATTAADLATKK